MRLRLNVALLVTTYLIAVAGANLLAHRYGPSVTPYTALGLVGFALITRDRLADVFGFGLGRLLLQAVLILAGSVLAYMVNASAAQVALASAVAFGASETVEAVIYYGLRRRAWLTRSQPSGLVGALIDSYLFTMIAFGMNWPIIFGQFTAKTAGVLAFSYIIGRVKVRRSEVQAQLA